MSSTGGPWRGVSGSLSLNQTSPALSRLSHDLACDLKPMDQAALSELGREIAAARSTGVVHVFLREASPPRADDLGYWIDTTIVGSGFNCLSNNWREIPLPDAVSI